MRILPSLSLLTLFLTLLGCRDRTILNCDRQSYRARAKGQDPRLYGIWYDSYQHEKVQVGKLKDIMMTQYSPGGYSSMGTRPYLNSPGGGVWYTEGDILHEGHCKGGAFSIYSSSRYRVSGDTLWLYGLNEVIDPENPKQYYQLRLRE